MKDSVKKRTLKDDILDATDDLLTRYGYRKMTIDDLAKEVGIGKGTVYLYFSSKEEIALSHIDRIIERLKNRLWEIADSSLSQEQKIRKMLIERVMFRFDAVQHYKMSLDELMSQVRPNLLERRKRYVEEEASVVASVLSQEMERVTFHGTVEEISRLLLMATNSLLPYSLSTNELGSRREIEVNVSRLAELLVAGITAK